MTAILGVLSAAWSFVTSRIGSVITAGVVCLALGFSQGWSLKSRLDRSATDRAIIAKQRVDLEAARDTAEQANAALTELAKTDEQNQGVINELREKLASRPPGGGACVLDDDTARRLRRLR
jgi:hypothetical protein